MIDLDVVLIGLEPLQTFFHRRMIAGKAGLPERVHDQPGPVAIRVREQRGVRRSVWPEEPLMAPPPRTERLQGPAAVGLLSALRLRAQRLLLPRCQRFLH